MAVFRWNLPSTSVICPSLPLLMSSTAFCAQPMLMYWLPTCSTFPLFSTAEMKASPSSQGWVMGFSTYVLAGGERLLRHLQVPVVGVAITTASMSARERISW